MTNLQKRIQKLEAALISDEDSGFIPHSEEWLHYWMRWLRDLQDGKQPPGKMPLAALRAIMASQPESDSTVLNGQTAGGSCFSFHQQDASRLLPCPWSQVGDTYENVEGKTALRNAEDHAMRF